VRWWVGETGDCYVEGEGRGMSLLEVSKVV